MILIQKADFWQDKKITKFFFVEFLSRDINFWDQKLSLVSYSQNI